MYIIYPWGCYGKNITEKENLKFSAIFRFRNDSKSLRVNIQIHKITASVTTSATKLSWNVKTNRENSKHFFT